MPEPTVERMPVTAHLDELRRRILHAVAAICAAFAVTFAFSRDILAWMKFPLNNSVHLSIHPPYFRAEAVERSIDLYFNKPAEAFWMHMKIAFVAGLFLAMPYILTQLWLFISPGLLPKEKKYAFPFVASASIMFVLGALFCQYFVLPFALDFLLGYDEQLVPIITIQEFVGFITAFMLAFGLIFQLPLIIALLARLGIVTPRFLSKNRKYAILLAFVAAAILTPTPDMFNQAMMAGPIIVFYEVGLILARIMARKPQEPASDSADSTD